MIYVLIAIISLAVLLQLVLRTNTGVVFLAICAGSVLVAAAGKDTDLLAHSVASGVRLPDNAVQAAVVLMPGVVSMFLLRKRVPKHKLIFAVIPALCSAVVGLSLVYPFLSASFQATLTASKGWNLIAQYYELVVVVGIVSSLVVVALTLPKRHHDDKHKKSKH